MTTTWTIKTRDNVDIMSTKKQKKNGDHCQSKLFSTKMKLFHFPRLSYGTQYTNGYIKNRETIRRLNCPTYMLNKLSLSIKGPEKS